MERDHKNDKEEAAREVSQQKAALRAVTGKELTRSSSTVSKRDFRGFREHQDPILCVGYTSNDTHTLRRLTHAYAVLASKHAAQRDVHHQLQDQHSLCKAENEALQKQNHSLTSEVRDETDT